MDDLIELGIEGADKLIDKGFHKVPDRLLHLHNPNKQRAKSGDRNDSRDDESDQEYERRRRRSLDDHMSSHERHQERYQEPRSSRYAEEPSYTTNRPNLPFPGSNPQYYTPPTANVEPRYEDQQLVRDEPRYEPRSYGYPSEEYLPPQLSTRDRERHRRYSSDGDGEFYTSEKRSIASKGRPNSSGGRGIDRVFSTSDKGLGASAVGAVAGGLLAYEAGKSNKKRDPWLTTLVGAAIGGLGANVLEKQYEKKKDKRDARNDRWEQKFGGNSNDRYDERS
jgi:hypothetical protein